MLDFIIAVILFGAALSLWLCIKDVEDNDDWPDGMA